MKNLLNVMKTNKKAIITKGIVVLSSVAGLLVTAAIIGKKNENEEDDCIEYDEDTTEDIDVETTEEE